MPDPYVVTWTIGTESADKIDDLKARLRSLANLSAVLTDRTSTLRDDREIVQSEQHSLSEYFDKLCVLPAADGRLPSVRLFFQRKIEANRFWKDMMASVLKKVQGPNVTVWIDLDYRVDDEDLFATAVQVPRWFSRVNGQGHKFWRMTATYLLTHPQFTFQDLADYSGVKVSSLKSMHRNSYRAIKRERARNPLWSTWDYAAGRFCYRMEPVIRDEILSLTENQEIDEENGAAGRKRNGRRQRR